MNEEEVLILGEGSYGIPKQDGVELDSEGRGINREACSTCGKEFQGYGAKHQSAHWRLLAHSRFVHGQEANHPIITTKHIFFRTNRNISFGINGKMYSGYEHTVPAGQYTDLERGLKARFGADIIVDRYDKA